MQILRLYIAPDLNFNRIGLSIKEKLSLHDIWTDKTDTISTISFKVLYTCQVFNDLDYLYIKEAALPFSLQMFSQRSHLEDWIVEVSTANIHVTILFRHRVICWAPENS